MADQNSQPRSLVGCYDDAEKVRTKIIQPFISRLKKIKPTTNSQIHIYRAKKPSNVTSELVQHFSSKGEIVLDPFVGSGTTFIEALKLQRKAVAIDISPLSTFITQVLARPVSIEKLRRCVEAMRRRAKGKVDALYDTQCKECGSHARILYTIYDGASTEGAGLAKRVRYECPKCGLLNKAPDALDLRRIREIERMQIPFSYPRNRLMENTRINIHEGTRVDLLFTRRNLIALSILNAEINNILDVQLRENMQYSFSASIRLLSKLAGVDGGLTFGFWIPPKGMKEINAWYVFEKKCKALLKLKEELNRSLAAFYKEAKIFEEIRKDKTALVLRQSSTDLSNIEPEKVDLIITDPPYGDEVPYLEESVFWNSWRSVEVPKGSFADEIVLTDSPRRPEKNPKTDEGLANYSELLSKAFSEMHHVLKKGRYACIWFHETELRMWSALMNAAERAGFEYLDQTAIQSPVKSFKPILTPGGTLRGHVLVFFRKPLVGRPRTTPQTAVREVDVEDLIVRTAQRIMESKGGSATTTELYDEGIMATLNRHRLTSELISRGYNDLTPIFQRHFNYRNNAWHLT